MGNAGVTVRFEAKSEVKSSRVVYDNHQHQLLFESLSK
jgi:hypothetical protein